MIVPAGFSVILYEGKNYRGNLLGPYTEGTYNLPTNFNDQLSSYNITRVPQIENCPTFYADYSLKGDSFQLCSSGNVATSWNDRVSSFILPKGYKVQLYQNYDFKGSAIGPYSSGTYNVPEGFNDQLSSVVITPLCPTFYADYNQQGANFQLCSGGNVPDEWNDFVSSFYVPKGFYIRLYQDDGYGGSSYGPYGAGQYNVPTEFNDQLSSVSVRRR